MGVMTGRGALVKPWLFQEWREGRELDPTAEERVAIYRQLVSHGTPSTPARTPAPPATARINVDRSLMVLGPGWVG